MFILFEQYGFLSLFLVIMCFLFSLTFFGVTLKNKNFLLIFLFLELLNGILVSFFILLGIYFLNPLNFIYALILLSVAAAESAIGLSLLINYHFVIKNSYLSVYYLVSLKG